MLPQLYIDPGSGSLLLQALIAGAISTLLFFKNIKMVVMNFFATVFAKFKKKND
ncbi:hypothetical protein [Flavobacterium sp.]|jgi:hypothetical protein|uniref:hypothetical protein n=1 Tax=Flavobacterium sp. TaxID=239 RepID=UPI0025D11894|nr:hypothetical protein [Flavobacterium sp.]